MDEVMDLRAARADDFEPHIGSPFRMEGSETPLELVRVDRYRVQPHAPRTEPFSLVFASGPGIHQGMNRIEHESLGAIQLFLVPIGPGDDGRYQYEAAFN